MLIAGISLFFLPTIIASRVNHPHKVPIVIINILGGLFFGVGWLVALVWSLIRTSGNRTGKTEIAAELEKLHGLKERGILTQAEFDAKKSDLLNA